MKRANAIAFWLGAAHFSDLSSYHYYSDEPETLYERLK